MAWRPLRTHPPAFEAPSSTVNACPSTFEIHHSTFDIRHSISFHGNSAGGCPGVPWGQLTLGATAPRKSVVPTPPSAAGHFDRQADRSPLATHGSKNRPSGFGTFSGILIDRLKYLESRIIRLRQIWVCADGPHETKVICTAVCWKPQRGFPYPKSGFLGKFENGSCIRLHR